MLLAKEPNAIAPVLLFPLLAHEYFGVDLEIVWNTVRDDLPLLLDAVQKIVRGIK